MIVMRRHEVKYATRNGGGESKALRSHAEVGKILGISRQAVHQMERVAIFKIRQRMLEVLKEVNPDLYEELRPN